MSALLPAPGSLHARIVAEAHDERERYALAHWFAGRGYGDMVAVLRDGLAW